MAQRRSLLIVLAVCCSASLWLEDRPAEACGGFFCGQVPVDQSGEHLLFSVEEDASGQRTIVAQIQVQYMGPAEEFAWILPLPSNPLEITTGSNAVFTALRQTTEPQFSVNWLPDSGTCREDERGFAVPGAVSDGDDFAGDGDADADGEPAVRVLQQSAVGPYESVVVESDDAQALITWLNDNDFTVPDNSLAPIQSYVNAHHVFLALKLQNDRSAGDITPIVVRVVEDGPCIPLLLTAIAATPDMPIYAWVLADTGIVSVGDFYEVQLNDAALAWFASGRNYRAVSTAAVNQAGGRGFIREYAGSTSVLQGRIYSPQNFDLEQLRATTNELDAIQWVIGRFPFDGALMAILREFAPMPEELVAEGVDEQSFFGCPYCWGDASTTPEGFDPIGLAAAIDDAYIRPLRDAQELIDRHPYVTRLFTTISPDEMTEDPIFHANPDVPDVSNVRVAQAQRLCGWGRDAFTAPIRLTLPSGRTYTVYSDDPLHPGSDRFIDADGNGVDDRDETAPDDMPALARALRHGEHGAGDVIIDNRSIIEDALRGTGGGCAVAGGAGADGALAGLLALALVGLGVRRRLR